MSERPLVEIDCRRDPVRQAVQRAHDEKVPLREAAIAAYDEALDAAKAAQIKMETLVSEVATLHDWLGL